MYNYLDEVNSPEDIKKLSMDELDILGRRYKRVFSKI